MKKTHNTKRTMKEPPPSFDTSETETKQEGNWAEKITKARKAQKEKLQSPSINEPKLKNCGC